MHPEPFPILFSVPFPNYLGPSQLMFLLRLMSSACSVSTALMKSCVFQGLPLRLGLGRNMEFLYLGTWLAGQPQFLNFTLCPIWPPLPPFTCQISCLFGCGEVPGHRSQHGWFLCVTDSLCVCLIFMTCFLTMILSFSFFPLPSHRQGGSVG